MFSKYKKHSRSQYFKYSPNNTNFIYRFKLNSKSIIHHSFAFLFVLLLPKTMSFKIVPLLQWHLIQLSLSLANQAINSDLLYWPSTVNIGWQLIPRMWKNYWNRKLPILAQIPPNKVGIYSISPAAYLQT